MIFEALCFRLSAIVSDMKCCRFWEYTPTQGIVWKKKCIFGIWRNLWRFLLKCRIRSIGIVELFFKRPRDMLCFKDNGLDLSTMRDHFLA